MVTKTLSTGLTSLVLATSGAQAQDYHIVAPFTPGAKQIIYHTPDQRQNIGLDLGFSIAKEEPENLLNIDYRVFTRLNYEVDTSFKNGINTFINYRMTDNPLSYWILPADYTGENGLEQHINFEVSGSQNQAFPERSIVPSPGALALFGIAGLVAASRRFPKNK